MVETMEADNGDAMAYDDSHLRAALPAIAELCSAGYFADDPNDLDSSFWQAASPGMGDDIAYFDSAPAAYARLKSVLNSVFETPPEHGDWGWSGE
jgi:hypothetical protein